MSTSRKGSVATGRKGSIVDPNNPHVILSQLMSAGSDLAQGRPGAREQLLNLSHVLITSLELPSEAIQRIGWAEPARTAHLRIAVDLDLFTHLRDSGPSGTTPSALSSVTGADPVLLNRMLKHLAAMNILSETESGNFASTPLSNAFAEERFRDGLLYTYDVAGPSFRHLPEYLRSVKYALPTTLRKGPFQAAHKTDLPFFEWLSRNPEYARAFDSYMSADPAKTACWTNPDFYPICDRLIKGFDCGTSEVFLVDVGGGRGHDLTELKEKQPSVPGKLVLQDKEDVVSSVLRNRHFRAMAHDFFTPQPVVGARAYYLHSVLHDWDDEDCVRILENLKPAVKRGYSRVLINEIVVPDKGATWPVTSMDQLVFVLGALRERTETDWRAILERAGYRITQVYTCEMGSESLIEAELA
ncbi:putative hydroxyindole O-methyltransferase [Coniochaeta sp. 2T2.1]|nr:putative hydroxyindole O-methyltransferase [Coniochaeta sp. 2T2.1]